MTQRDSNLQQVIDLSERIIAPCGKPRAMAAGRRVFERLRAEEGPIGAVAAQRLPVCHHAVEGALAGLAALPAPLPELASAFSAVEARLQWTRRKTAEAVGEPFFSGHANAMLVGPAGLEQRGDRRRVG